ncbi:MAG: class I SAM-dependent methyltransferase [Acidobacteriota bacterium]
MRGLEQIPWFYDAFMAVCERFGLLRWRRKLTGWARGRVLEVGCGTGRNLELYGTPEPPVAFDPCLEVVLRARRRRPDARLLVASAEDLPFRDGAFDHVVSCLVFCSVPDPERGLREVARVLDHGGELLMMEHVRHTSPGAARAQDLIQPIWTAVSGGCHPNRDTESTVRRAGFEIDPGTRRARGVMRLLIARPVADGR